MKKNKGTELEVKNGEGGEAWGYGGQRRLLGGVWSWDIKDELEKKKKNKGWVGPYLWEAEAGEENKRKF